MSVSLCRCALYTLFSLNSVGREFHMLIQDAPEDLLLLDNSTTTLCQQRNVFGLVGVAGSEEQVDVVRVGGIEER